MPLLADDSVLQHAVQRYEHCWLPLLSRHAHNLAAAPLAPPLDVAWVWFAHTIAPVAYRHVCTFTPEFSTFSLCKHGTISAAKNVCMVYKEGRLHEEATNGGPRRVSPTRRMWRLPWASKVLLPCGLDLRRLCPRLTRVLLQHWWPQRSCGERCTRLSPSISPTCARHTQMGLHLQQMVRSSAPH